jgi:dihydropteroate synthase
MICKPLGISPENALNGTTALHMVALQHGARILRAHDVREAKEVIQLWQLLQG